MIKIISLLFFLALPLQLFALNNLEDENFQKKLNTALINLESHKSFEVEFTQEMYSALRQKINKSSGVIKISTPNRFCLELQKPRHETHVSNGIDFWKFIPELNHAQHLNSNALELNYLSLLTNPANIKKFYTISHWTANEAKLNGEASGLSPVQSYLPPAESAEVLSIKLEPKEDNQQKVLYAILNVRKGSLVELRIVRLNGNRVRLLFTNDKPKSFDEKTFSFVPPKGIVVDKN